MAEDIDECCICLDSIKDDAIMLDPCCHYMHNNCFKLLKSLKCPSCTIDIKTVVKFDILDWSLNETNKDNYDDLSDLTDQELLRISYKEMQQEFQNCKDTILLTLKTLDGLKNDIKVPMEWTVGRLREWIGNTLAINPSSLRIIHKGCPLNDIDPVKSYNNELLHIIRQCSGS